MELPKELLQAIYQESETIHQQQILMDAQKISERYREEKANGKSLLTQDSEAIAYSISRMPATYHSVAHVLETLSSLNLNLPTTMLDIGAGTGAATWAAYEQLPLKQITCLEREDAMLHIGQRLMNSNYDLKQKVLWEKVDIVQNTLFTTAELILSSYVLNELKKEERFLVVQKLWQHTQDFLILVEPGTTKSFSMMQAIKQQLIEQGANLIAPCSCIVCPLPADDWCHFSVRVPRTQLHKRLKGGKAPFEDEKFTYLIFSKKQKVTVPPIILRHPQMKNGHVIFKICSPKGIQELTLSKKDGASYKQARKLKMGDYYFK